MTFKLTDLGKLLEAQLAAGSKPIITRIEGSDAYSSNPEALLAVQDVKQTLQVEAVTVVDGKSHLKFILSNIGLNEEYYLKQIGIYAKQTEDSEEILYFIGQDRNGERIPAISEKEVEFEYDLTITVDNAYEVTVAVSGNDFARKEMLEKKIDGNGGDISETVIAATAESEAEYPVPAAGDSTKTAFGKIIKFFGDLRNWMTGVCLLGQIVNNCVTNRSDLPLSAAMGKQLQDAITVLNTNQKKAYRNIAYDINTVQSAPGTITDQEIVFRVPFDTIPIVIVSIESSTTNANYGKITAFVDNRSKTGFTLRLANASENNLTPAIAWVAIAK